MPTKTAAVEATCGRGRVAAAASAARNERADLTSANRRHFYSTIGASTTSASGGGAHIFRSLQLTRAASPRLDAPVGMRAARFLRTPAIATCRPPTRRDSMMTKRELHSLESRESSHKLGRVAAKRATCGASRESIESRRRNLCRLFGHMRAIDSNRDCLWARRVARTTPTASFCFQRRYGNSQRALVGASRPLLTANVDLSASQLAR